MNSSTWRRCRLRPRELEGISLTKIAEFIKHPSKTQADQDGRKRKLSKSVWLKRERVLSLKRRGISSSPFPSNGDQRLPGRHDDDKWIVLITASLRPPPSNEPLV